MKYLLLLLITANLFAWELERLDVGYTTYPFDWCGGYGMEIGVNDTSFLDKKYINSDGAHPFILYGDDVHKALKMAIHYWNEAGSEVRLSYNDTDPHFYMRLVNAGNDYWANAGWSGSGIDWWDECVDKDSFHLYINVDKINTVTAPFRYAIPEEGIVRLIAHELGHVIGIAHTDLSDGANGDGYTLMRGNSASAYRFLSYDDKYAARNIYGKDEYYIRTTQGIKSGSSMSTGDMRQFESGSMFESNSHPSIVFQPNSSKDHDYVVAYNRADSRWPVISFTEDCGSDDMCSVGSPLEIKDDSPTNPLDLPKTLTAPGFAVSEDGSKALVVWRQEEIRSNEQFPANAADRLHYAIIYIGNSANSSQYYYKGVLEYDGQTAYARGVPTVITKGNKFYIFFAKREANSSYHNNWHENTTLSYVIVDKYGTQLSLNKNSLQSELTLSGEEFRISWNRMAGTCDLAGSNACLLYINRFKTDLVYADGVHRFNQQKVTELRMSVDTNYSDGRLHVNSTKGNITTNYGHLNVMVTPDKSSIILSHHSGDEMYHAPELALIDVNFYSSGRISSTWTTNNYMSGVGQDDYILSTFGHAGVLNERTGKYRMIWIRQ